MSAEAARILYEFACLLKLSPKRNKENMSAALTTDDDNPDIKAKNQMANKITINLNILKNLV